MIFFKTTRIGSLSALLRSQLSLVLAHENHCISHTAKKVNHLCKLLELAKVLSMEDGLINHHEACEQMWCVLGLNTWFSIVITALEKQVKNPAYFNTDRICSQYALRKWNDTRVEIRSQKYIDVWTFGADVKSVLGMPMSYIEMPGLNPGCLIPICFLLICTLGGSWWWLKHLGSCQPHSRLNWVLCSWFQPALAPTIVGMWGVKLCLVLK